MFLRPGFQVKPSSAGGPAHSSYGAGNIHELFNWIVGNAVSKAALVPTSADLYKCLWQIDTATAYVLTSVSPITWAALGGTGGGTTSAAIVGPVFYVWASAQTAIPLNTTTKVNFQTKVYDSDNCYSTATSTFTCSVAGYYHFTTRIGSNSGAINVVFDVKIRKNGVETLGGELTQSATNEWVASGDLQLAVGDTVDVAVFSSSAMNTQPAILNTYFQGHFIRPLTGSSGGGSSGGTGSSLTPYTQTFASALSWVVNHNLGYEPDITVLTSGGVEMEATVTHVSVNQAVISFAAAQAGRIRAL